jgi:hypothetical protein
LEGTASHQSPILIDYSSLAGLSGSDLERWLDKAAESRRLGNLLTGDDVDPLFALL